MSDNNLEILATPTRQEVWPLSDPTFKESYDLLSEWEKQEAIIRANRRFQEVAAEAAQSGSEYSGEQIQDSIIKNDLQKIIDEAKNDPKNPVQTSSAVIEISEEDAAIATKSVVMASENALSKEHMSSELQGDISDKFKNYGLAVGLPGGTRNKAIKVAKEAEFSFSDDDGVIVTRSEKNKGLIELTLNGNCPPVTYVEIGHRCHVAVAYNKESGVVEIIKDKVFHLDKEGVYNPVDLTKTGGWFGKSDLEKTLGNKRLANSVKQSLKELKLAVCSNPKEIEGVEEENQPQRHADVMVNGKTSGAVLTTKGKMKAAAFLCGTAAVLIATGVGAALGIGMMLGSGVLAVSSIGAVTASTAAAGTSATAGVATSSSNSVAASAVLAKEKVAEGSTAAIAGTASVGAAAVGGTMVASKAIAGSAAGNAAVTAGSAIKYGAIQAGNGIMVGGEASYSAVVKGVTTGALRVEGFVVEKANVIKDGFNSSGIGQTLSKATHKASEAFSKAGRKIASGFDKFGNAMSGGFTTAGNSLADVGTTSGNGVAQIGTDAGNATSGGLTTAGNSLADVGTTSGNGVAQIGTDAGNAMSGGFTTAGNGLADVGTTSGNGVAQIGTDAGNATSGGLTTAGNSLANAGTTSGNGVAQLGTQTGNGASQLVMHGVNGKSKC